jgi:vanillate O-demethylase ferredoxin subunit
VDAEVGCVLDVAAIVAAAPARAHLYCCGPAPMLEAFLAAAAGRPVDCVHVEYFSAPALAPAEGGFVVVLARSGREIEVPRDATILDTLRAAGLTVPASCEQGVCGTCETRVIEGVADHRDLLLTPAEKASNKTMMICCSGSLTPRLVLDL